MNDPVIVVHYHELWLKGGNRRFFLGKLFRALRQSLEGIPVQRIEQPGDRFLVRLSPGAPLDEAERRIKRVLGIAYYAVAHTVERDIDALCRASWEEVGPLSFRTFAVRAKRSDKSFPQTTMEIEAIVGRYVLEKLRASGRRHPSSAEGPGTYLPHRNYARTSASVRAKNSWRRRFAGKYRRAPDVSVIRRVRFRRCRISHDEARGASEFRTFSRNRRRPRGIIRTRGKRTRAHPGALSVWSKALLCSL